LVLAICASSAANAYWVRPVFGSFGLFQDGLDINGVTYDEQFYSDAARAAYSRVDIANGTVGVSTRLGDPGVHVSDDSLYANALYGETITFGGDAPSVFEFSLDIDGFIETDIFENPNGPGAQFPTIDLVASIAIFEGNTAGTMPLQWASTENLATALFYDEVNYQDFGSVSTGIFETISGSLDINPYDSFDIVVRMYVGCSVSSTDTGYCEMDFSNTASFGTTADPSTFTSTSGEFLGSQATVPVPGAAWLFGSALVGFVCLSKKRSKKI
jgi:hypothetical protein